MAQKITLYLEEDLVRRLKDQSRKTGKSVSRVASDLLRLLQPDSEKQEEKIPPIVASLKGILKGKKISEEDYKKFLEEKYL